MYAVRAALLLADRNQIARVERLRQERQGSLVLERVGHLAGEHVTYRNLGLLHRGREVLGHLALHGIAFVVRERHRFLRGRD